MNIIPYLSIIINCHNDEQYIQECIESVIAQINNEIEIICVDDDSVDNSSEIIQQYSSKIIFIRFNKNVGLSYARTSAMKIANGKYIMFIDGDDYIAPESLLHIIPLIKQNCYDVIIGLMEVFKDTPDVMDRWNDPNIEDSTIFENKSAGEILSTLHNLKLKIAPVQKYIVKKSFIESNNLCFEDVLHEDQLWTPKMLCCANSIGFINYKFYFHRIRKNSLGDRFDERVCESYFQTCKKLLTFASKIDDGYKVEFLKSRCLYLLKKINIRINDWDESRRKAFLDCNKNDISFLANIFSLCFN